MSQTQHRDDLNTFATVVIGIVSVVLVFALIVALDVLYYHVAEAEVAGKSTGEMSGVLAESRAQQEAQLTSYGWVDREAGIVHIPIDVAMKQVVERLGSGPNRPGARRVSGS